ncbi:uncharacterized protein CIMG_02501 [Coccidioides immitis RS]|uniref:Uncharacterized protein n=4 Tax=Coccidioides immitis TaxID=5501 RepID=A0A0E1RZ06_COCIM|nr:uncharacterized protein CIMG_02501 [Coccidioides immitis RS]KMP10092.1 hypothetical protein CIRG_09325 [Coccidioides immitis RMSCC 2394]KMU80103.1 hypothetical protein CISG_08445 [Coccidioides immitis RMSCC 3703]KMU86603.1 hypothetical protein CIHG_04391 [Coccidioides immitis H538.4]TPX24842.1 hypothetical protein DIZ76_010286 [Coccidioides immitis]EAS37147.1 hypothetical protein CIMG_02501 [Coccidioides immitis RS]
MKFFGFTLLFLQAFLVCAQATTQPKLENFTLASGSVTNTLDPNEKYEKESRDINEVIELDPTNITMAIPPEDLPSGNPTERQHARDLSKRPRKCPVHLPWLCDGVVCFNRFTHMCCKGGFLCQDPRFCVMNAIAQMACR